LDLVHRRFHGHPQISNVVLELSHALAGGRELRFAGGSNAQAKPVGDERRAIQAQPLDEEPSFGSQPEQAP
jgi:hypothetical protein